MFDADNTAETLPRARSNRPPVMEIRDLNLWYGEKQALIDVNFDLHESEILAFIGPSAEAIRAMGDKAVAKRRMIEAGVPCVPGYQDADQSDDRLAAAAAEIGFPVRSCE